MAQHIRHHTSPWSGSPAPSLEWCSRRERLVDLTIMTTLYLLLSVLTGITWSLNQCVCNSLHANRSDPGQCASCNVYSCSTSRVWQGAGALCCNLHCLGELTGFFDVEVILCRCPVCAITHIQQTHTSPHTVCWLLLKYKSEIHSMKAFYYSLSSIQHVSMQKMDS